MTDRHDTVTADSYLTLRYHLATEDGETLVSTLEGYPSTLQMGSGQLAPTLEAHLLGMRVGERRKLLLDPAQAFGLHNAQLVQRIACADLPAGTVAELGGVVEILAGDGQKIAARVREVAADSVLLDFNHPLAGRRIRFEAAIIGIL